jgi:hypothetical protein
VIRLLFAAAVAFFVLSLPVSKTEFGAWLRRAAGVCLVLALLPALIWGLFFSPATQTATDQASTPPGIGSQIASGLSCFGALVILSLGAYAILALRKKLFRPKKDPWETYFARGGGKKRVHRTADDDRDPVDL